MIQQPEIECPLSSAPLSAGYRAALHVGFLSEHNGPHPVALLTNPDSGTRLMIFAGCARPSALLQRGFSFTASTETISPFDR